jgi:nucleoid-associated protein YgaU
VVCFGGSEAVPIVARKLRKGKLMFGERLTDERLFVYDDLERMYAIQTTQERVARWHLRDTPLWRARWAFVAAVAAVLLVVGYGRAAASSSLVGGATPAAAETVTVAPGDTLWDIASGRYPGADTRQKVFEIEQLNGLSGPSIEAGQHLRVPAR